MCFVDGCYGQDERELGIIVKRKRLHKYGVVSCQRGLKLVARIYMTANNYSGYNTQGSGKQEF